MHRTVIDASGRSTNVELTEAEEAKRLSRRGRTLPMKLLEAEQRAADYHAAQPAESVLTKLRSGAALSAAELQAVIRWQALRP